MLVEIDFLSCTDYPTPPVTLGVNSEGHVLLNNEPYIIKRRIGDIMELVHVSWTDRTATIQTNLAGEIEDYSKLMNSRHISPSILHGSGWKIDTHKLPNGGFLWDETNENLPNG